MSSPYVQYYICYKQMINIVPEKLISCIPLYLLLHFSAFIQSLLLHSLFHLAYVKLLNREIVPAVRPVKRMPYYNQTCMLNYTIAFIRM